MGVSRLPVSEVLHMRILNIHRTWDSLQLWIGGLTKAWQMGSSHRHRGGPKATVLHSNTVHVLLLIRGDPS